MTAKSRISPLEIAKQNRTTSSSGKSFDDLVKAIVVSGVKVDWGKVLELNPADQIGKRFLGRNVVGFTLWHGENAASIFGEAAEDVPDVRSLSNPRIELHRRFSRSSRLPIVTRVSPSNNRDST